MGFMANLEKFGELRRNFSQSVDFVTIYIEEAHPVEEGHYNGNYDIRTHRNIAERLSAAQTLREDAGDQLAGSPILVDPMDDRANLAYAALPERLYVVMDNTVIYEGGFGPFNYNLAEVERFLAK